MMSDDQSKQPHEMENSDDHLDFFDENQAVDDLFGQMQNEFEEPDNQNETSSNQGDEALFDSLLEPDDSPSGTEQADLASLSDTDDLEKALAEFAEPEEADLANAADSDPIRTYDEEESIQIMLDDPDATETDQIETDQTEPELNETESFEEEPAVEMMASEAEPETAPVIPVADPAGSALEDQPVKASGENEPMEQTTEETPEEEKSGGSVLLIGFLIGALLGIAGYLMVGGDTEERSVSEPPAQSEPAASSAAVESDTTAVPAAKTVIEEAEPEAAAPMVADKMAATEPASSSMSETDAMQPLTSATDSYETIYLEVDPVTRKVITPMDGKTDFAWAINLISLSSEASAKRIIADLRSRGTASQLVDITMGDKHFFRVRIPEYADEQAANLALPGFKAEKRFAGAWVSRYRK